MSQRDGWLSVFRRIFISAFVESDSVSGGRQVEVGLTSGYLDSRRRQMLIRRQEKMVRAWTGRKRKNGEEAGTLTSSWLDADGLHAFVPGVAPSPEAPGEATKPYQKEIRNSPLWDDMVRQFGEKKAERLLLEFRVELR